MVQPEFKAATFTDVKKRILAPPDQEEQQAPSAQEILNSNAPAPPQPPTTPNNPAPAPEVPPAPAPSTPSAVDPVLAAAVTSEQNATPATDATDVLGTIHKDDDREVKIRKMADALLALKAMTPEAAERMVADALADVQVEPGPPGE